ncbi:MAG: hypothetical protein ACQGVC_24495 [Myxococcota bacterium]
MRAAVSTYLLCVATCGGYALFWIYCRAKDVAGRDRAGAAAWALGSIAAPVACLVLYDLASRARTGAPANPLATLFPAALHAAIALVLLLSPISGFVAPAVSLMPIPLSLVAYRLDRARRQGAAHAIPTPDEPPAVWRRVLAVGTVVVGLPLSGWLAYLTDSQGASVLLGGRDDVATGTKAAYTLTIGDPRWRSIAPGTIGDEDADLELMSDDLLSWVIVYVHPPDSPIDAIVDGRRDIVRANESLTGMRERRYFLSQREPLPASLARYDVGGNAFTRARYLVLTAVLDDGVVEVVGYASGTPEETDSLDAIVSSLQPGGAAVRGSDTGDGS